MVTPAVLMIAAGVAVILAGFALWKPQKTAKSWNRLLPGKQTL